jgi:hypothetical protein
MTMNDTYRPDFTHTDWLDHVDRVQAGGDRGLNTRFHDVEAEFDRVAKHVNALHKAVEVGESFLTLVPILATPSGSQGWKQEIDGVTRASPNHTDLQGVMNVALPNGSEVKSLLVTGTHQGGGSLSATLRARDIRDTSDAENLITATEVNEPAEPQSESALLVVSNDTHRYYVVVGLTSAPQQTTIRVSCIQLRLRRNFL